ncbi:PilZ domain-containing protein [Sphingomonas aracearum]|uniref:PilZ domain-containing protein n=1 Tax=Sphingomonas aracearum TaxID=2283317 RepID=A0A369VU62_9SPHN|nr:PilZ domain-containing protein [Sphingomonas aracearum]RDE05067.1 PilZ domain-containing protein [Sphingomonas aracearum]
MFAAEYEPALESTDRRRSPRAPVSLDAKIGRGGLDRTLCRVVDLSEHGARLQTYSALKAGTRIWLTLPGVGQVIANVVWADDFLAGCQFEKPLKRDVFDGFLVKN